MIARQLEQRRALKGGVAAAGERLLQPGAHLRRREILVGRRHHEGGARQDPQKLGHALARLLDRDGAGSDVTPIRDAIALGGGLGVELGRGLAAPHGLDVHDQIDEVFDRRLVLDQAHGVRAGERQAQGELGLREPAIELMPEEPRGHRLGAHIHQEHVLPGDEHVLEPHLPVQLVEAARQRRQERIRMPRGDLAAEHGHARRGDGHGEGRAVLAAVDAAVRADVDVFGVDRARVHADLAADDDARVGLVHEPERDPFGRVGPHTIADRRRAGRERQEPPGAGDPLAVRRRARDLLGRHVTLLDRVEDAERDQVAVRGRVRDVAGAQKGRRREALAHRA